MTYLSKLYIKLGLENKMKTNTTSFLKDLQLAGIILFLNFYINHIGDIHHLIYSIAFVTHL